MSFKIEHPILTAFNDVVEQRVLETGAIAVKTEMRLGARLKVAVFTTLPGLMTFGMIAVYSLGIYRLNLLYKSNLWRSVVVIFAQEVKVVGNKMQLKLTNKVQPPAWLADSELFGK